MDEVYFAVHEVIIDNNTPYMVGMATSRNESCGSTSTKGSRMGNDVTRILSRQMAQRTLTDDEINVISGGGPYEGRSGLSPDSLCDTGTTPGMSGTMSRDDCAADPLGF